MYTCEFILYTLYSILYTPYTGDGSGIVLVGGTVPGSNAAAADTGKDGGFRAGDTLTSVTAVDSQGNEIISGNPGPLPLTGLNYDKTLNVLSQFGDFSNLRFTVQRLRKRGEIVVSTYTVILLYHNFVC
jgi:hypothetical protein